MSAVAIIFFEGKIRPTPLQDNSLYTPSDTRLGTIIIVTAISKY